MKDGQVKPANLRHCDQGEIELLDAMKLFDTLSVPVITLQRACNANGTKSGYRCSIPLYANDPSKVGQLIASIDGDGDTAAEAIRNAVNSFKVRAN